MASPSLFFSAPVFLIALLVGCAPGSSERGEPTDHEPGSSTDSDDATEPSAGPAGDDGGRDGSRPDSGRRSDSGAPRDAAVARADSATQHDAGDAGGSVHDDDGGTGEFDAGAQVGLPPGVSYLFPPPNGMGLCPDPPLRLRFTGPPTLGSSGKIQVYDTAGGLVASVDMATTNITDSLGGTTITLSRQAFVEGNDAIVRLKNHALAYGKSYYVTVDSGAIKPPGGGTFSISGATGWRFSTRAAPANLTAERVALDGSGDFCSVQGALDALPASNTSRALVTVAPGLYHEVVHMRGKSNVTIRGEDRKKTIILGTNNNTMNPSTATRALVGFDSTNGLIVENLTIHNLTPQGGSQAEALRLQGCDKCVVRHADIVSLQDTLLWSGRIYADDCYVEGNVDYVWGTGVVYFNACEFRTVGRTGVLVQSRNAAGAYGYVFVDSKLTADAASTNNMLARIDASVYPGSHVAFINCEMNNVAAAGWSTTGGGSSGLRFWEYQSHDAAGNPVGTSGRMPGSTRISAAQAATMRDTSAVLNGWTPTR